MVIFGALGSGATAAAAEWILFIDADCTAPADLLDRYFLEPVGDDVGALVGEVFPAGRLRACSLANHDLPRNRLVS